MESDKMELSLSNYCVPLACTGATDPFGSCSYIEILPCEILRHIFLCLDRADWKAVVCVSKEWYSLAARAFMEILIYKGTKLLQLKHHKRSVKYFDQVLYLLQCVSKREGMEVSDLKAGISLALSEEFITKKSRVLNNKAVALMNLKQHEDAIKCLEDVLVMKPDHVKAMNNLGDNLNSLQKYDEAIKVFDRALELDPTRLSVLYNKGNSYLHMKQYHEAVIWYDKAIQVLPKDVDSLGNKAIALYRLGCLKEAVDLFTLVLKYNPKDRIALRYRDVVAEELRKKESVEEIMDLKKLTLERKRESDIIKRPNPYVLGVVGGKGVGKTSLVSRIIRGSNAGDGEPIEVAANRFRFNVELENEWYIVDLIDIDPSEEALAIEIPNIDGAFLMYSVDDDRSFDAICSHYDKIASILCKSKDIPCLLIGNKVDLRSSRKVNPEQGKQFSSEFNFKFLETSTQVPINVSVALNTLLRDVCQIKEAQEAKKKATNTTPSTKRKEASGEAAQPITPNTEKRLKKLQCNIY